MDAATPASRAVPPPAKLPTGTTLAYGFGTVAYGVKDFAFATFLLLFYNQVLGLPASQVGLVIMLALVLDAFIDPAIGFLSDRTRGSWGRRHPWMYGSAIPIAIGWLLLWNPPAWSDGALLGWLFVFAVLVRTAVSCYEVPSQALSAELTADYDDRTRIMAYRYLFGWAGGLTMLVATYSVFLAPAPGEESGLLNRAGYIGFSIAGAAAMVIAIIVSARGTHHEIPRLTKATASDQTLAQHFAELLETIRNRAFGILMLAGLAFYTAQGISFAMSNYLYVHVWRFQGAAFSALGGVLFLGAAIAFLIAPRFGRRFGRPAAAMVFMAVAAILLSSPYFLRLLGLMPEPGSAWLLPILFSIFVVNTACNVSSTILGASMMADVVEDSESKTGRRSEGVFFAGAFFIQKCTSGLGILASGLMLDAVGFPEGAAPGSVPLPAIDRLTLIFGIVYTTLGLTAAFYYRRFPFGRAAHVARVAELAAKA